MKRISWQSMAVGMLVGAGLAVGAVPAAAKTDVCALYKKHAPKDVGLQLDKAVSATPEFCQAWAADRNTTLLLRVWQTRSAPMAVTGTRQSAVNSGNGKVADESGLGSGAWSNRSNTTIEITFTANGNFVQVMFSRDPAVVDADVARVRAFARAVAGSL
jgi:hypothetical protein